jgi:hypothetical protein
MNQKKHSFITLFLLLILFGFLCPNTQAQEYAWAGGVGGTGGNDRGYSIAVDGSGNVYVTGYFENTADFDPGAGTTNLTSAGGTDIFFAKYDANGALVWAHKIGASGVDEGRGIKVDASGNVYITGYFKGTADFDPGAGTTNLTSAGEADVFFAKYDTNGALVWAKNVGGTGVDRGYAITLDASNNVYISGDFQVTADFDPGAGTANLTSAGTWDGFFAKYDANGDYVWAKSLRSLGAVALYSIVVDGSGNVYVSGNFQQVIDADPGAGTAFLSSAGSGDIFFGKYDSNGDRVWAHRIGSTGNDTGAAITVDGSGNVYLTGDFIKSNVDFDPGAGTAILNSKNDSYDTFFAKYATDGTFTWVKQLQGGGSFNRGTSISLDGSGNIFLAGIFGGTTDFDPGAGTTNLTSGGLIDMFFAKYDASGALMWAKGVGDSGGVGNTSGNAMAVDNSGNVYVTGDFARTVDFDPEAGTANLTSVNGTTDMFFAKYSPPAPEINLKAGTVTVASGGTYDFGNQILATSSNNTTFTIENIGSLDLTLSGAAGSLVALSGTDATAFLVTQTNVTSPIAASSNKTFEVRFIPSKLGVHSATLTITSNDANEGTYTINLTGTGTKNNQTITFGALAAKNLGDAPFNLTATASSGLTVTYASSNTAVATVSGSTVTIVGAGTTTITASQAGNTNYNAAPDVSQNLVIEATNIEINVPSVFTPNGDGNNDRLRVIASVSPTSIDFKVFNNLQQVYRTTNVSEALNQGWDGAGVPSNKLLAYQLTYTFAGQRFTKRGIVTLIR